jgi:hypothetical protein
MKREIYQTQVRETPYVLLTFTEYQNNETRLEVRTKEKGAKPRSRTVWGRTASNWWDALKDSSVQTVHDTVIWDIGVGVYAGGRA